MQPGWMYRAIDDFDNDHMLGVVDGDTIDLTPVAEFPSVGEGE